LGMQVPYGAALSAWPADDDPPHPPAEMNSALAISLSLFLLPTALAAQVAPVPAPPLPAGPIVILTDRALDGRGGALTNARIGVAQGKITSLDAPASNGSAAVIDLRGYTVLPGWIDTHVHLDSHFDRTGAHLGEFARG
jgi:Adenine deaminase